MGSRLFVQILESLQEEIGNVPFIDLLHKLEKLELIDRITSYNVCYTKLLRACETQEDTADEKDWATSG